MSNLRTVEKKVLGAMLILANDDMVVKAKMLDIARAMGYRAVGGAITFAIDSLEMKNLISKEEQGVYRVLL